MFSVLSKGGRFGLDRLPWINGGLFDGQVSIPLDDHETGLLKAVGSQNWGHIDPTIFGTLLERFLDPEKRSQIGAHYTDIEKISKIIDPVVMQPLKLEWQDAKSKIVSLIDKATKTNNRANKFWKEADEKRSQFLERLKTFSILDPACGSGNFLYVALKEVKELEYAVNQECEMLGLPPRWPIVGPEILKGIELSPVAAELARTTIWIGDIQWGIQRGFRTRPEPILRKLDSIECRDALLAEDGTIAKWPRADVIIGNPPFLGANKFLRLMDRTYVESLRAAYKSTVSPSNDLVSFWLVRASEHIADNMTVRAGLVATNTIRQSSHAAVLNKLRIAGLFCVWNDEPWVNEGASVRVCIVCFGPGQPEALLNGHKVSGIRSDLAAEVVGEEGFSISQIPSNLNCSFQGSQKIGRFDIPGSIARQWLLDRNPHGKPNSDVLKPLWNGIDITQRPRDMWVVDYGSEIDEKGAALYQKPFLHVLTVVRPEREKNNREAYRRNWWKHGEPRIGMRKALKGLKRYLAISEKSKHFFWQWVPANVLPDKRLIVVAREDDLYLGLLSPRFHAKWAFRFGSKLEDRPCYTPTTCFSTYPFPMGLSPNISTECVTEDLRAARISLAARCLDDLRQGWLGELQNRPAARSMTNLYNDMPTWLRNAHDDVDRAVAAAYGWPKDISEASAMSCLVSLNALHAASTPSTPGSPDAPAPRLSP